MLAELAGDQRLTVATLQEGDGFDFIPFIADIDQQPEMAAGVGAQVVGEVREFVGAILEDALGLQLAPAPGIGGQALRIEVEEAAGDHVLILLMTS